MAPSDAGGLDAVQNRTLPHYTEWCIEVPLLFDKLKLIFLFIS